MYWERVPYSVADHLWLIARSVTDLVVHALLHPLDGVRIRRVVRRSAGAVRVSLGCGQAIQQGWIGLDLDGANGAFRTDLRRDLPFSSSSVDAILAEHVLEHLFLDDVVRLLHECNRVLRPGGVIRVVSPDGLLISDLIRGCDSGRVLEHLDFERSLHQFAPDGLLRLRTINRLVYQWGDHRSVLTGDGLTRLLTEAGFEDVAIVPVEATRHFDQVPDTHVRMYPQSANESVAVEGVRAADRRVT